MPIAAKMSAAASAKPAKSSAKGAAKMSKPVAVGILIAAPERASILRKPSLAVTSALPKQTALTPASMSAWFSLSVI
jgi:hypothetical protein